MLFFYWTEAESMLPFLFRLFYFVLVVASPFPLKLPKQKDYQTFHLVRRK